MTAKQIREEGEARRRIRVGNVRVVIRNLRDNAIEAWMAGDNKWQLTPLEERRYRNQLSRVARQFFNNRRR